MPAPIVFLDTETCGLDVTDPIWEVAAVRRDPDGTETEYHAFVWHDVRAAERLPESFRADHDARYRQDMAVTPFGMVDDLRLMFAPPEDYRQRAHVAGAVPSFDTERLGRLFRAQWADVPWHHHLIDVETLAVGWLRGRRHALVVEGTIPADSPAFPPPPWDSDDLSRAIGVDPDQYARHTAMGDIRWAMAIYDAVMGGAR